MHLNVNISVFSSVLLNSFPRFIMLIKMVIFWIHYIMDWRSFKSSLVFTWRVSKHIHSCDCKIRYCLRTKVIKWFKSMWHITNKHLFHTYLKQKYLTFMWEGLTEEEFHRLDLGYILNICHEIHTNIWIA